MNEVEAVKLNRRVDDWNTAARHISVQKLSRYDVHFPDIMYKAVMIFAEADTFHRYIG